MSNENNQTMQPMTEQMEEGISIKELLHIFRIRMGWFIICFVIAMVGAVFYMQRAIPEYESQVTILVEPIQRSSSLEDMLMSSSTSTKISTEVELITSRKNIEKALGMLDLNTYLNSEGMPYSDPKVISYASVKERITVSSVKDTNLVRITVKDSNLLFARDFANALEESYDALLTSIARNSQSAQRAFIESQIPINEEYQKQASEALGNFRESTDIIQLSEKSSLLVQKIAYFQMRREPLLLQNMEATTLEAQYLGQLEEYGATNIPTSSQLMALDNTKQLLTDLETWKTEFTMYESVGITSGNTSGVVTSASPSSQTRINTLLNAINQATKDLQDFIVKQVAARITLVTNDAWSDSLVREYSKAVSQVMISEIDLQVLQVMENSYTKELGLLPSLERQLLELQRNVSVYESLGLKLREMLEEVKLVEAAVTGNVIMIDPATLPDIDHPVSPNKLMILAVGFLLGCALGVLVVMAIEMTDVTIRDDQQIKKIIGRNIPLLGWLPLQKLDPTEKYPSLVVYNDPQSFEAERYKLVASNMIYGNNRKRKVFSITSSAMAEGKSSVVGNIATSLAQLGMKILVVDGDLRLPSMERFFNLKHSQKGLVDHIIEDVPLEECIIQPLEKVPNLHLLPPGTSPLIPPAIFASEEFNETMTDLREIYDYILIDAPPLQFASEMLAIAKRVDGLVVAVRAGITTKGSLEDLMISLNTIDVPVIGVIFNGVITSRAGNLSRGGRYYSTNYAYNYRYSYTNKGKKGKKRSFGRHASLHTYRKKYKADLKKREKVSRYGTDEPVLAFRFGIESAFISNADAAGTDSDFEEIVKHGKSTPATVEHVAEVPPVMDTDFLADLEADPDAVGKHDAESKKQEEPQKPEEGTGQFPNGLLR